MKTLSPHRKAIVKAYLRSWELGETREGVLEKLPEEVTERWSEPEKALNSAVYQIEKDLKQGKVVIPVPAEKAQNGLEAYTEEVEHPAAGREVKVNGEVQAIPEDATVYILKRLPKLQRKRGGGRSGELDFGELSW